MSETKTISPIFKAQIKECCRTHYEIFVSAILAITFVLFLSFDKGANYALLAWVSASLLILLIRFVFILWFNRLADENIRRQHIQIFVGIMIAWGLIWCIASFLFFPLLDIPQQAAWFAMFMVMIAASATSHAVYMPVFYAFALPYFAGMLWMVATQYPSPFHINTIVATLIMVTQIGAALKGNKMMIESLKLRYKNLNLIEELKIQKEQAEHANYAKSKFLAAASHDLRQPLHSLTLFTSALQSSLSNKEKTIDLADKINLSVEALQGLFNALLDISRLDAGTFACEKEHFHIQILLGKLKNDFTPLANNKELVLEWDEKEIVLFTDPMLLQLILRNLLSNALRYTNAGKVSLCLEQKNRQCTLSVSDTGIGIPSEDQEDIFSEFVQLHNPERDRTKGLGLGLAIVKRVTALLGSKIYLQSTLGSGSSFSFTVDVGDPKLVNSIENIQQDGEGKNETTILVIDDEVSILEASKALLETWGYKVIVAVSLANAQQEIKKNHTIPSCIIADHRLRENQSGVDAIKAIQSQFTEKIPGLIISGDISTERLIEIKNSGFEILHKPIQPARLRSFLQTTLHKKA